MQNADEKLTDSHSNNNLSSEDNHKECHHIYKLNLANTLSMFHCLKIISFVHTSLLKLFDCFLCRISVCAKC